MATKESIKTRCFDVTFAVLGSNSSRTSVSPVGWNSPLVTSTSARLDMLISEFRPFA